MDNNSSIIDTLRNVRGADDIIERLKANSLEARRDRIAEALKSPDFKDGPANLVATYPKHVLALKEGVLMRIALEESEDSIKFGKIEIFDVPAPATDIGAEIIETARAAVDAILNEDFETATPMVTSIARALDIKGNLQHQIVLDVRLRSLTRDAWWQEVVAENYEGEAVKLPLPRNNPDTKAALTGSIDDLLGVMKAEGAELAAALTKLDAQKGVKPIFVECARDVSEDIKGAISTLLDVNRESVDEMQRVYEAVGRVAPRLVTGSKFLVRLANNP